ncbi:type II secretion system protein GspM [Zoogloea sp.]|uniref:type II secretion system protein GspM n=1 Tax=Zoogloea sp. TaxID=49181 RepID=UPI0035B0BCB6
MSPPVHKAVSGPIAQLTQHWQSISPRERRLVRVAAGVVAVAAMVAVLDWSWAERQRLARSLPRAEAGLNQIQEAATEIGRLRATTPPTRPDGPALIAAVQASARSRSLDIRVQAGGEGVHLKGQARFDDLVDWLGTLQKDQGLRVLRMDVQRQGPLASVDAVLAGPAAP